MKERKLFEGELEDGELGEHLTDLIHKAKSLNEDVFLIWNNATIRISEKDNRDSIIDKYLSELLKERVFFRYKRGDLIETDELAKKIAEFIKNFIGK